MENRNIDVKNKRKPLRRSKNKNKNKRLILTAIAIVFVGVAIFSGYKIFEWAIENNKNNSIKDELKSAVVENKDENTNQDNKLHAKNFNIDFDSLKNTNSDVVGWIKVNNTQIEYPVVQAKDNDYYLTRNIKKEYNGAGWIFADYRNNLDGEDKNIVLYGHNRKDGSMFGDLKDSQTEGWYGNEDNKYIVYITPTEKSDYEVFSVYNVAEEDYYITTKFRGSEFGRFINKLKSRSAYDFGVEVSEDDSIITLSTCAGPDYRTVLHAKKVVEEQEEAE